MPIAGRLIVASSVVVTSPVDFLVSIRTVHRIAAAYMWSCLSQADPLTPNKLLAPAF